MAKINEIMSKNVVSLPYDTSIAFAAQRMRDANVGVILATEQDPTKLYGVVSDRDLNVRVSLGRDPKEMKLAEVCSRQLATLSPTDEVGRAEELMAEKARSPGSAQHHPIVERSPSLAPARVRGLEMLEGRCA